MTKQEIIEIVQSMEHQSDFRSYYQFAHNYLRHMQINGITDAGVFWDVIRHCQNQAERKRFGRWAYQAGAIPKQSGASVRIHCRTRILLLPARIICAVSSAIAHISTRLLHLVRFFASSTKCGGLQLTPARGLNEKPAQSIQTEPVFLWLCVRAVAPASRIWRFIQRKPLPFSHIDIDISGCL